MVEPVKKHLLITYNDQTFVLGTLSFNVAQQQFIYQFTYPDGARKHLNIGTGKLTNPYDHITWHQNLVHMKRGKTVVEEFTYNKGPLISGKDYITPLMVETVRLSDEPCLAHESEFVFWKNATREHVFDVEKHGAFSTVLLLVPHKLSTNEALGCMWRDIKNPLGKVYDRTFLRNLCDECHTTPRFQVWPTYDILLLCSSYYQQPSKIPSELGTSYRIPNYSHPDKGIKELIYYRQSKKLQSCTRTHEVTWLTAPLNMQKNIGFPSEWAKKVSKLSATLDFTKISHPSSTIPKTP